MALSRSVEVEDEDHSLLALLLGLTSDGDERGSSVRMKENYWRSGNGEWKERDEGAEIEIEIEIEMVD